MALNTLKSIQLALNLVESKKENLRKAFEDLQAHSLLSPLSCTWDDIVSYIDSTQSVLRQKFSVIQAQESSKTRKPKSVRRLESGPVPARPELKSLCENMDGLGFRKYVLDRPKERTPIRVELADALRHAPDPGSLILDALDGFCVGRADPSTTSEQGAFRRVCVVLLEEFRRIEVEIGAEVKDRAKAIAAEWAGVMSGENDRDEDEESLRKEEVGDLVKLGFLLLLAAFKLVGDGGYDPNELIDHVVKIAKFRQAVELCHVIGLESRVSEIVQKLISKGKQLLALKFIFEYELTDEFPPVPLLKAFVMNSENLAQKVRQCGKSSHQSLSDASSKEINALKAVIKCVEDHSLESEYPKSVLVKRIEKLEKERADRKRPATAASHKSQQQAKRLSQNGHKRGSGPTESRTDVPSQPFLPSFLPSSLPRAGLLPDHTIPYLSTSAGAYGVAVSGGVGGGGGGGAPPPYAGSSSGLCGLSGTGLVGLNPAESFAYPSEPHAQQYVQPGYYDGGVGYGVYNVPSPFHPVYYQR